ncbi:iron ABC transporter permease [Candidatus Methylospira mobilis]|uniref:Iron ABC transporter permease n=1 Tax=Candidatus Methylospira mobilis TaxID=1808979 RepID=A0A5Q0BH87_9GAMM|nr:iron ABC transporter permease [Candidatus Methylospira mobilis]QFY41534.1 iron ABC transporter permease [Candidatus Methylospira mobilis]WNV05228.1 iron ABC transporter permease [Candidatus Methylospira mobilis]
MILQTALPILLCATVLFSLTLGRYPISCHDILQLVQFHCGGFTGQLDIERLQTVNNILLHIRLPRIIAAAMIGAALSVSGAAFQSVFRNPLVSPGLLGVLAGASFGAALAMMLFDHWLLVQISAFAGGIAAVLVALAIAAVNRFGSILFLVLGGMISTALFSALLSLVKYAADPYNQLPAIVFWLMGSLANTDPDNVWPLAPVLLAAMLGLIALGRYLDAMSMGDEEAQSLGVSVQKIRMAAIILATLIGAMTVALAGSIGWIGLIVPHIARLVVGTNCRVLLPASAWIGAIFLLLADDLARDWLAVEMPIGVLTELLGIAVFLLVLRNIRKGWV